MDTIVAMASGSRVLNELKRVISSKGTADRCPTDICQVVLVLYLIAPSRHGRECNLDSPTNERSSKSCRWSGDWNEHKEAYVGILPVISSGTFQAQRGF